MSHSSLLLLLSIGWSVVLAQTAPDLAIEITQEAGHSKLVLRNVYRAPVQAYAIDFRDSLLPPQSQCLVYNFLTEGTGRIEPNGTSDVPLPDVHTLIRIAVVYTDGAMVGNPEVLRQLIDIRAAVRRSVPFAERAFRDLAAREGTLSDLIRDVEGWRQNLRAGGFSTLTGRRVVVAAELHQRGMLVEADPGGRAMLHERIHSALRNDDSTNGPRAQSSLSEAVDRVVNMLNETEEALSMDPTRI